MALGNIAGFVDKRHTQGGAGNLANAANYANETAMDARLTAVNPTYYTAARLRQLTFNDKRHAVRLADDAGSI